jgi:hypothetical protein
MQCQSKKELPLRKLQDLILFRQSLSMKITNLNPKQKIHNRK